MPAVSSQLSAAAAAHRTSQRERQRGSMDHLIPAVNGRSLDPERVSKRVGSVPGHFLRRQPNITPASVQRLVLIRESCPRFNMRH